MSSCLAAVAVCALAAGSGCAPSTRGLAEVARAEELVWPAAPMAPRLAFVTEFSGAEDLGVGTGFLQQLRALIGGSREVRLVRPTAVVKSADNRYYIADPGIRGVHRFDLDRKRYRLIQGENGEPLPSPVALAAGISGEVYVTDSRRAALFVIEPGESVARKVALGAMLSRPTGIALDGPSGRIYLVDTRSHEIKIFARDGALLRRVGGRGTGAGQFNYPTMIWMTDAGELLVSDTLNFRTQVFDAAGNYRRQFIAADNGAGFQAQSKGIASDSQGHVFVVDSARHALQIFDDSGRFLYRLGMRGDSPGEFLLPAGIFVDDDDLIYVADSLNGRIQVFRYTGGSSR